MKTETVLFDTVAPHPATVPIANLLTEIEAVINKHVILSPHAAAALAVWVLHTYTFELRDTVAYVAIESPEKRCGKTTLLSVLAAMACKPLIASNITVGALFRSVHTCMPTLFIDEADTFMAGNSTMRGIINSGNTRRTAYVLRLSASKIGSLSQRERARVRENCSMENSVPIHGEANFNEPATSNLQLETNTGLKKYSCWCPKVIAMIGEVPDTIADRSIVVKMARKLTTETCAPLAELESDVPQVGRVSPLTAAPSPSPTSESVPLHSSTKDNGPTASPSPWGDLSRLGNGERNQPEGGGPLGPSERARASQRWGEGELTTNQVGRVSPLTAASPSPTSITTAIRSKCARFALDNATFIRESPKIRAQGLNDRAADTFDPLFVIARLAGHDWEAKLRAAALALSATADAENSGAGLILDILDIFADTDREKIFTRDLVPLLRDGGLKSQALKPGNINEYQISKILRHYGVKPNSVRIGKEVRQGYLATDFQEAVRRYVSQADIDARMERMQHRWQLQSEAHAEAVKQQAFLEKMRPTIHSMVRAGKSQSEINQTLLKLKQEHDTAEVAAQELVGQRSPSAP
jgi:hypothetical protein